MATEFGGLKDCFSGLIVSTFFWFWHQIWWYPYAIMEKQHPNTCASTAIHRGALAERWWTSPSNPARWWPPNNETPTGRLESFCLLVAMILEQWCFAVARARWFPRSCPIRPAHPVDERGKIPWPIRDKLLSFKSEELEKRKDICKNTEISRLCLVSKLSLNALQSLILEIFSQFQILLGLIPNAYINHWPVQNVFFYLENWSWFDSRN